MSHSLERTFEIYRSPHSQCESDRCPASANVTRHSTDAMYVDTSHHSKVCTVRVLALMHAHPPSIALTLSFLCMTCIRELQNVHLPLTKQPASPPPTTSLANAHTHNYAQLHSTVQNARSILFACNPLPRTRSWCQCNTYSSCLQHSLEARRQRCLWGLRRRQWRLRRCEQRRRRCYQPPLQ